MKILRVDFVPRGDCPYGEFVAGAFVSGGMT